MKANVYSRPAKPLFVSVKQRDDFEKLAKAEPIGIVAVDKATECHVTPDNVADRMVSYLGPTGDYLTLEPSAGTGVPITFEHPDAQTLEVLPSDTFASAKVNTKIIRIVKG